MCGLAGYIGGCLIEEDTILSTLDLLKRRGA